MWKSEQLALRALMSLGGQAHGDAIYDEVVAAHTLSPPWALVLLLQRPLSRLKRRGYVRSEERQLSYAMPGEIGPARQVGTITVYSITEEGRKAVEAK
jgi:hypothetical protein